MITSTPSQKFHAMRVAAPPHEWQRQRMNNGWSYADAARSNGITIREWAMLECGTTPEDLRTGRYPRAGGRTASKQ